MTPRKLSTSFLMVLLAFQAQADERKIASTKHPALAPAIQAERDIGRQPGPARPLAAIFNGVPEFPETSMSGSLVRPAPAAPYRNAADNDEGIRMESRRAALQSDDVRDALSDYIAYLTFPDAGSVLSSAQVFRWNDPFGTAGYWLWAGSCDLCSDLADLDVGYRTSATVNLPSDGRTIHVTLFTRYAGDWHWRKYTFRAGTNTAQPSRMTSPRHGERLAEQQRFTWEASNASS